MKSLERGKSTSGCEVTNISQHGFWILADGTEYFLPFEKFPWFKDARIGEITEIEFSHGHHLHWPKRTSICPWTSSATRTNTSW